MFSIFGREARWYGLLFAGAFAFGQMVILRMFRAEGKPDKDVEAITIYMLVAVVLGARLGHCLLYEPEYYLSHPLEILKVWKGGLASHGAAAGILAAIWLYSYQRRADGQTYLWVLDRIVITVALGGALIRMGNLMNSEIIGRPTDVPWAFIFAHSGTEAITATAPDAITFVKYHDTGRELVNEGGDHFRVLDTEIGLKQRFLDPIQRQDLAARQIPFVLEHSEEASEHFRPAEAPINPRLTESGINVDLAAVPRHPAQLYESLSTFATFLLLFFLWNKMKSNTPQGLLFGIFCILNFGLRFCYEFLKENQVEFEDELFLNMGQILSIPLVIVGIIALVRSLMIRNRQSNA